MSRISRTTWNHVRRSPYQALAAILIKTLTFFVLTAFAFVIIGSAFVINYFESQPQVIAFFKSDAKQENIDKMKADLMSSGKVTKIKYVSKDEAFKRFIAQNKDEGALMTDLVTADILPPSLEISTANINDLEEVYNGIKSSPYLDRIAFPRDIVAGLKLWTNAIRRIGVAIISVLIMVSIFVMATIIGFKISQKKEEIEIMRLLSATKWYVRWPFILEGIFYGVMGALFGWLLASLGLLYATPFLQSFLGI